MLPWCFSRQHVLSVNLLTLCVGITVLKLYLLVGLEFKNTFGVLPNFMKPIKIKFLVLKCPCAISLAAYHFITFILVSSEEAEEHGDGGWRRQMWLWL